MIPAATTAAVGAGEPGCDDGGGTTTAAVVGDADEVGVAGEPGCDGAKTMAAVARAGDPGYDGGGKDATGPTRDRFWDGDGDLLGWRRGLLDDGTPDGAIARRREVGAGEKEEQGEKVGRRRVEGKRVGERMCSGLWFIAL